ncbi:MAG: hypothetical protein KA807_08530 [Prolixibacteraceae bacterium]|nr:hypothetical protein [Prolixibacteraceae bacterium]
MNPSIDFQLLKPLTIDVPLVSTKLNLADKLGTIKVRCGIKRDSYKVSPGLYKVGSPDSTSDVLISANYKLSFDALRKNLGGMNVWILVIDTKGVNVWCAAGKGTFSTANIVKSLKEYSLESIVSHRKIIVPQLAATGVSAHKVKTLSGFNVLFGPIHAKDLSTYIKNGYKATPEMREMKFPIMERMKLIPVDFLYRKYYLLLILAGIFFLSGLDKTGFLFSKMIETGIFPVINIIAAYFAGIVLAPALLPWIPFRAFATKGAILGILVTVILYFILNISLMENISLGLINTSIASFMMMNFTGSSTFTSVSGVKKEMKFAVPVQVILFSSGIILFVIFKLVKP